MGAQVTYPSTENDWYDSPAITDQKILQRVNLGGGAGAASSATLLHGAGDPAAAPGDAANLAFYYDETNDRIWAWNPNTATWTMKVA